MTPRPAVLLGLALLAASSVAGQEIGSPPIKSEGTALTWSLLGTAMPIGLGALMAGAANEGETPYAMGAVLIVAGVVVGPALGHFYAGRPGRGATGIGVRVALTALTLVAATGLCLDECLAGEGDAAAGVFLVGFALTTAAVVYDIATAPRSVRLSNQGRASLSIVPTRLARRPALAAMVTLHMGSRSR